MYMLNAMPRQGISGTRGQLKPFGMTRLLRKPICARDRPMNDRMLRTPAVIVTGSGKPCTKLSADMNVKGMKRIMAVKGME